MNSILLIDADSKIPNLALMKLSTYYKSKGYLIKLIKLGLSYYPPYKIKYINASKFNKVYVSIIFTPNKNKIKIIGTSNIIFGGTGYSISSKLKENIEKLKPDYSIYPKHNYSIGFISRGCIRKCKFCFVPKKEGKLKQVAKIKDIIKHKKVIFLDNNFLALPNHKKLLKYIAKSKVSFQFNQGLDCRLLTKETALILSKMNTWSVITFAYDNIKHKKLIETKLKMMAKLVSPWKLRCFIYVHPNMQIYSNIVYRIKFCTKYKILPYIMRDLTCYTSKYNNFYIDLAAWGNQPSLFKNMLFKVFLNKRHPKNKLRQKQSLKLWKGTNE